VAESGISFISRNRLHIYFTLTWTIVGISIASRLLFHGQVFGFDYFLFQPDGAAYTYMALRYSGLTHLEAANEVIRWYAIHAEPGPGLEISFFSADTNPAVWGLVSSRIAYPLLSAPFVYLFGIAGMLVFPILSFLLLIFLVIYVGKRLKNHTISIALVFFITISTTTSRWFIANITDGLLAAFLAIACILALHGGESVKFGLVLSTLVVVGSFTRFSLPYWLALGVLLLTIGKRNSALIAILLSIACFLPSFVAARRIGAFVPVVEGSTLEKTLYLPLSALRISFIEFAQLAAVDRSLLVVVITAIVLSLLHWRNDSSRLFLLFCLAGWSIGALNGTLGVNFRYQLPVIFMACYVIIEQAKITITLQKKPMTHSG
jgi:hypothetical protein